MYWRALLMQPAVLAALSSMILGGQTRPQASTWLHRCGVFLCLISALAAFASLWVWLQGTYPLEQALLYFCLCSAASAVTCLLAAHGVQAYKNYRVSRWQSNLATKAEDTAAFALEELEEFARENPKTAAALIAAAGYLVAGRAVDGIDKLAASLNINDIQHKGH